MKAHVDLRIADATIEMFRDEEHISTHSRQRIRANCIRIPDLEEMWQNASSKPGSEQKLIRKDGNFTVLVLDEWLIDKRAKLDADLIRQ